MDRSRYYKPARPPVYTYFITGFAALLVFSSIIYLNVFHQPPGRLKAATRFPPEYPRLEEFDVRDSQGTSWRIADGQCSPTLLSLASELCAEEIEEQRSDYEALASVLSSNGLLAPPLILLDSRPFEDGAAMPEPEPPACLECAPQGCFRQVQADWATVSRVYSHFNQALELTMDGAGQCEQDRPASWILLDPNGKPRLFATQRRPAPPLARDFARIAGEMASSSSSGQ